MGDVQVETLTPLMEARAASPDNAAFVKTFRLYDSVSTLLIKKEVAEGYLVLLSGGLLTAATLEERRKSAAKKKKLSKSSSEGESPGESSSQRRDIVVTPDEAIQLAFISITDGNVVDSTLGVQTTGGTKRSKDTSSYAFKECQEVKNALRDAAESSDSLPRLAVETYQGCFEIVIDYHEKIEDLGLITYCYKHQAIEKGALEDLEEAFGALLEAVDAAT
eukprot:CAMPEP_0197435926 /NCGR_PEP_ID=MMETSP1175-20131217/3420_1 /TAXON_ID=1003142 /ORGANISM="Triceratium dubium, Strain CCMP147" /LENGTH=219 /DNA_ID=CAMNT_0042965075 /DNA_START=120 /DNA_END=779 /DNA_ORIENTATION=-